MRGWSGRRALGIGVLLALMFFAARLLTSRSFDDGPMPPPLAVAGQLPVRLPDGRAARLGDGVRAGVPTVVTLWASWCGPCRREASTIADLRRRFGSDRLNLIYLNVRDPGAGSAMLSRYMRDAGMQRDGYVMMDDAPLVQLTKDLTNAIPRTYVFDRAGTPVAMIVGYKPLALARVAGLVA